VGGASDIVNETVAGLIPNWVKDRLASGSKKVNENVQIAMPDKYKNLPAGESITEKLAKKIDEPTQYMSQSASKLQEGALEMRNKANSEINPEKKALYLDAAKGMESASQEITKNIGATADRLGSLSRSAEATTELGTAALVATPTTVPIVAIGHRALLCLLKKL